jgi:hypothetical protein
MNFQAELADYELTPFPLAENAYQYKDSTPAHSFTTVVANLRNTDYVIALTARDHFDANLAASVIGYLNDRVSVLNLGKPINVIPGFNAPNFRFDCVAVLSSSAHHFFEVKHTGLQKKTLVVFPCFRYEFSGEEEGEEIQVLRSGFVFTVDWDRPGEPYAKIKCNNPVTGVRTKGKEPVLVHFAFLTHQLRELPSSAQSFIEITNFKNDIGRITPKDGGFRASVFEAQKDFENVGQIVAWVTEFLKGNAN